MTLVYRDLDQDTLDREYDNQRKVGNFPEIAAAWGEESAIAREGLRHEADIAYGPSARERLDLFPSTSGGRAKAPIHLFIHGGYWYANDKSNHSTVALGLKPHGFATLIVNYGRTPDAPIAELVAQCRRAVTWARENAAAFGGDPDHITISGHSAGAQLAAMLMVDQSEPPLQGVQAAFGISGVYDLDPVRLSYLNKILEIDEASVEACSPCRLTPSERTRFTAFVGGREGAEYERQSASLFYAWSRLAEASSMAVLAEHDHFSILRELNSADGAIARAISATA